MNSLIVRATAVPLAALLVVVSLFVLIRGHDEPGGGFIGGLIAASGHALLLVAFGAAATRRILNSSRVLRYIVGLDPRTIIAVGLALLSSAAVLPMVLGDPLLQAQWWFAIPHVTKVGTVLIFDIGVYLTVLGTSTLILTTLIEE
ncbi:MAG: MnhB domain-containing protein [Myxococcota bacterium]